MPARLTVFLPDRPALVLALREEEEYVLGRDPRCEMCIEDERVSRRHARLVCGGAGWQIDDLGSKNGSLVNGSRVSSRMLLPDLGWLSLGGVLGRFECLTELQSREESDAQDERRRSTIAACRRLEAAGGLDALVRSLLDSVIELARAERGFVLLARPNGDLAVAAASGLGAGDLGAAEFSGSIGAVEKALATGRPVAAADALADPVLGGRESVAGGGIRALVCVPLCTAGGTAGRRLGAIYADSRRPGSVFTELDVEILETLAARAALAVAAARLDAEVGRLLADVEVVSGRAPMLWSEVVATQRVPGFAG